MLYNTKAKNIKHSSSDQAINNKLTHFRGDPKF